MKIIETSDEGIYLLTKFSFIVNKVLKGDKKAIEKEISVMQDGTPEVEYDEHRLMDINKKYILFLKENDKGELLMVGGPTGKYEYKKVYAHSFNDEIDIDLKKNRNQ